jgi:hypothetical protein
VDVADELLRAGLLVARAVRAVGRGRVDGGFVVEAVQVAAGGFEVFDPFLGLLRARSQKETNQHVWTILEFYE